jgi:hypothetical protein
MEIGFLFKNGLYTSKIDGNVLLYCLFKSNYITISYKKRFLFLIKNLYLLKNKI